ncbi:hypothetical protein CYLTODRAFT_395198 [Cylindrobasidium torrendii FP15055 ss-10]|uniref:Macrofage activating glyco protein n=1 Tax=Cylindrobasidium torrendii FP15055 ss-10 TaxID=1314674 RepID=A0A0D7BDE8_9AGAR|nr:hypothetical protein CYLTODRAFT_395198 [Cylindrobasidium torrendii FP15055 ss-10]
MAAVTLFTASLLAVGVQNVRAQEATGTYPATALAEKTFAYNDLPYQVDTDQGLIRGTQFGYNICNSTTAGQDSKCQTSIVNSISDFCLWAPDKLDIIANTEGEEVAWCTNDHGARLIPEGTITGLQVIETDEYVQMVGFINGPNINIEEGDFGGELDPHGADLRGNPMGGVVYSNHWSGNLDQVHEWHLFISSTSFCYRICKPDSANAPANCQHIYDRIGCAYNDPNDAKDGVFEVCKGDVGLAPGLYIENGQTMTYTQPAESLGAITSMPYTATIPPYSQCTTMTSKSLYTGIASVSGTAPTKSASGSQASATGSAASTSKHSGTATGSSSAAGSSSSPDSALSSVVIGGASIFSVILSAFFLA